MREETLRRIFFNQYKNASVFMSESKVLKDLSCIA